MRNLFQVQSLGIRNGVWSDRFVRLRQITSWALAAVLASSAMILTVVVGSSLSAPDAYAGGGSWTAISADYTLPGYDYVDNTQLSSTNGETASTVGFGRGPFGAAIDPTGTYAFISDQNANRVRVYAIASNALVKIISGNGLSTPQAMSVSPDGTQLWVSNYGNSTVSVFCIASGGCGAVAQWGAIRKITTGSLNGPIDVAITPNGAYAYVSNYNTYTVTVICASATLCGGTAQYSEMSFSPLAVTPNTGVTGVDWTSFTPDGLYAFVANCGNASCSTAGSIAFIENPEVVPPHAPTVKSYTTGLGYGTNQVDISPNCSPSNCSAYITDVSSSEIQEMDNVDSGANPTVNPSQTITSGLSAPTYFAFTPDSKFIYVTDYGNAGIDVVNTSTNTVQRVLTAGGTMSEPWVIAMTPDQAPTASFLAYPAPQGVNSYFNASSSSSPIGSIASYAWDFGDGCTETLTSPTVTFAYPSASGGSCPSGSSGTVSTAGTGPFTVSLTVTNTGGTSTVQTFTGHTMSNNGGPSALKTQSITLPSKLAVTTSPIVGSVSSSPNLGPITIQMQGSSGAPINAPPAGGGTVSISLSASSGTFSSWNGTACSATTITSSSLAPGTSLVQVCYGNPIAGSYSLTFASSGLTSATQNEIALNATKIVFTSAPVTGLDSTSATLGPISIALENGAGTLEPNPAGVSVSVGLSSSSTGGIFALTSGGATVTAVTIGAGASSATFYYGDSNAGTPTITASLGLLTSGTQVETINSGSPYQIGITTKPLVGTLMSTNPNLGPITIAIEDSSGNPTNATTNMTVTLSDGGSGGSFSLYSGGACQATTITSLVISTGTQSAQVCYGNATQGLYSISATTTGLTVNSISQNETVLNATKIVFTSASVQGPASSSADIGPITITLENGGGTAEAVPTGASVVVSLSSSSGGGIFSLTSGGATVTTVTIGAGASAATFYYGDNIVGSPTLTASAGLLSSGTQSETVTTGIPYKLVITTSPLTGATSATPNLGAIAIAIEDSGGSQVNASANQTVTLSSTSGTGAFSVYSGGSCSSVTVSSVIIVGGTSNVSICYGDITVGTPTITATTTGLTVNSVSQTETVNVGPPYQIVITSASLANLASSTPDIGPIDVAIQDAYGNPSPVGSTQTITVSSSSPSGTFSAWTGTSCSATTFTSFTIATGSDSAQICYGNTLASTQTITLTTTGLTVNSVSQSETVTPQSPYQLAASGSYSGPKSSSPNMGPITVSLEDQFGNPTKATSNTTVNVSDTPTGGLFSQWTGSSCSGATATSFTIAQASTSISLCFGSSTAAAYRTTYAVTGLPGANSVNLTETVQASGAWLSQSYANNFQQSLAGDFYGTSFAGTNIMAVGDDYAGGNATYGQISYQPGAGSNWELVSELNGNRYSVQTDAIAGSSTVTSTSCPVASFCGAADSTGDVYVYAGGAISSWTKSNVDGTTPITAISCADSTGCLAVDGNGNGFYYNGSTWSTSASGDTNALESVSCVSDAFCMVVDSAGNYLTFDIATNAWVGPTASGDTNTLTSVSCAATNFCEAVDNAGKVIVYTGGAGNWGTASSIDANGNLKSISCPSTTFCGAVDQSGHAVIATGAGPTWGAVSALGPTLSSISCSTASTCIAVGGGNGYGYTGSAWLASSSVDGANTLDSVSCATPSFCVGGDSAGNAVFAQVNGTGISAGPLSSISCPASNMCVAVGSLFSNGSNNIILTSNNPINPFSWTVETLPSGVSDLFGVSCGSTSVCFAVGLGSSGADLIESTNGGITWTDVGTSISQGTYTTGTVSYLSGISCYSASECIAAGVGSSGSGSEGVVLYYNGSTWTVEFYDSSGGEFTGVSCPSSTECFVSGDGGGYAQIYENTSVTTAPGTWTQTLSTSAISYLYDVGCISASACYGVGFIITGGGTLGTKTLSAGAIVVSNVSGSWQESENDNLNGSSSVDTTWWGIACNSSICSVVGSNNQSPFYPMAGYGS